MAAIEIEGAMTISRFGVSCSGDMLIFETYHCIQKLNGSSRIFYRKFDNVVETIKMYFKV